jgi:hypothetical protein
MNDEREPCLTVLWPLHPSGASSSRVFVFEPPLEGRPILDVPRDHPFSPSRSRCRRVSDCAFGGDGGGDGGEGVGWFAAEGGETPTRLPRLEVHPVENQPLLRHDALGETDDSHTEEKERMARVQQALHRCYSHRLSPTWVYRPKLRKIGSLGVCRVGQPILSRPVGWPRSAALHPRF